MNVQIAGICWEVEDGFFDWWTEDIERRFVRALEQFYTEHKRLPGGPSLEEMRQHELLRQLDDETPSLKLPVLTSEFVGRILAGGEGL